jgi:hypothetical protein
VIAVRFINNSTLKYLEKKEEQQLGEEYLNQILFGIRRQILPERFICYGGICWKKSLNCSVALSNRAIQTSNPSVSDMATFHFTIVNGTYTVVGKPSDEDPTILASIEDFDQEDIMQPLIEIKLTKEEEEEEEVEDQEEEVVEAVKAEKLNSCELKQSKGGIERDGAFYTTIQAKYALSTVLPKAMKQSIERLSTQCFGETKSGTRCFNRRRKLVEGKCWCHWHLDQMNIYEAYCSGYIVKDASFIPSWWKQL